MNYRKRSSFVTDGHKITTTIHLCFYGCEDGSVIISMHLFCTKECRQKSENLYQNFSEQSDFIHCFEAVFAFQFNATKLNVNCEVNSTGQSFFCFISHFQNRMKHYPAHNITCLRQNNDAVHLHN